VLVLPFNVGVGGAMRAGFLYAERYGYDVVVQVDADGQHDPARVCELLDALERTGADMVIGSRFAGGAHELRGPRRLAMGLLARRAAKATGTYVADATSGFRAIRRPLLDRFATEYPIEYLGDTVEALIQAGHAGATVVEHPIAMAPRAHGSGSAGLLASCWYVARVLVAIELMHKRAPRVPLDQAGTHGWSD